MHARQKGIDPSDLHRLFGTEIEDLDQVSSQLVIYNNVKGLLSTLPCMKGAV